jgi:GNAT superfamily N-acetyltransferase
MALLNRLELKNLADFTPEDHAALKDLQEQITFGLPPTTWTPGELTPWRVLLWEDDRLISHVGILERTIDVGSQPVHVAGIRSVMTRPTHRGQGYASQAMTRAADFIAESLPHAEHGLLCCLDIRVPLYRSLGWSVIPDRTIYDQPEGPTVCPVNIMVKPFRGIPWPAGEVNLKGLPW